MDARELKELLHVVLEHKDTEQLFRNITFIVSYLISEQDKRQELTDKLDAHSKQLAEHDKDMMLTKKTVDEMRDSSKANGKMLRAVLVAVLSGIVMELIRILLAHKP